MWQKDLTGAIELWIEVGLPDERIIRKACGRANKVVVMIYGGRAADMWWSQNSKAILKLNNVVVINLPDTDSLTQACSRNMDISCTKQDSQILVSYDQGSFDLLPVTLT